MIKEQLKFNDSDIFEGMTSISAVIRSIIELKSTRKILTVYIDEKKKKSKFRECVFLEHKADELGFEIKYVDEEKISAITVGNTHGGIVAECTHRQMPFVNNSFIKKDGEYFILDGIEDPYNFGNAVRSLYALGVDGIILGERNWLGAAGTVARASAGTSELIASYVSPDLPSTIKEFKKIGYKIICAGIRDSVSIAEADLSKPLLVILGGEKRGISRNILDLADNVVRIDYGREFKGSLSASASASVLAFEILRYNNKIINT